MSIKYLYECDYCDKRSKAYPSMRELKAHTRRWTHESHVSRETGIIESHRCDDCTKWEQQQASFTSERTRR